MDATETATPIGSPLSLAPPWHTVAQGIVPNLRQRIAARINQFGRKGENLPGTGNASDGSIAANLAAVFNKQSTSPGGDT